MTSSHGLELVWQYLCQDLHLFIPAPWLQITLALASVMCGGTVGAEREKHEKPAGLRTLVLVCLGSASFTMASYAFTTTTGDSGRVAAQIVTGIGFLGAGAILHSAGIIRGMTTAATIWATAAIGMVVGIGYAGAGLGLSLLVRGVLTLVHAWENRHLGDRKPATVTLEFQPNRGKTRIRIEKIMEDYHVHAALASCEDTPEGNCQATLRFRLPRRHRREFLQQLALLPEIVAISES